MKIFLMILGLVAVCFDAARAQTPGTYSVAVQPGYNAIANQLDKLSNRLSQVLTDVPPGSTLLKWNPRLDRFESSVFQNRAWSVDATLAPGDGAFLHVNTPWSVTFQGTANPPQQRTDVFPGYNFISCQTPAACSFEQALGFGPEPGDRIYFFSRAFTNDPTRFDQNASSVHRFTSASAGWNPPPPPFAQGRGVMVFLSGAPRILSQPSRVTVEHGSNTILTVRVLGEGPLTYQWLHNGALLPGQARSSLTITGADASDAGTYLCSVSNALGRVTSDRIDVNVLAPPPLITQQPQPVMALVGENVTFSVKAEGTPPLTYQWFKNTQPISIVLSTMPMLTLERVKPADDGIYFVRVSNGAGNVMSQGARLMVIEMPRITEHPASQSVPMGSNVVLRVNATGGALRYQWRKNGENIPGETNSSLTIRDFQAEDGGSYRVIVVNKLGSVVSEPALLRLDLPMLPFLDNFPGGQISGPSGLGQGTNRDATLERGEPPHAGKTGGGSVWLCWTPPSPGAGTVVFETAGSEFDTLLAAYEGTAVDALTEVDSDDDSGPGHTSRIEFNAEANKRYWIAVDGFNGARGRIVLRWTFVANARLPMIVEHPRSQVATSNETVKFSVTAASLPGVPPATYQWLFNDVPIDNASATLATYTIPRGVQGSDAGVYSVRVTLAGRTVVSRPARLEVVLRFVGGGVPTALTVDKLADLEPALRAAAPVPTEGGGLRAASVSFGWVSQRTFRNYKSSTEEDEIVICDQPGGASRWLTYIPNINGRFFIDTEGSDFDTLIGVFTGTNVDYTKLTPVTCDDNSGADGRTSKVNFQATANTRYRVVIDGVNGATGLVQLNHTFLIPMTLTNVARSASNQCRFRVSATPTVPFTIESSDDIVKWSPMLTTQSVSGLYDFRDTNAPATTTRFYRASQNP